LEVNRLHVEDGAQVKIEEVLLISDANGTRIGTPFVENAMVLATALRQARGKKVIVFKYKPKKRYRHKRGHRQELTILSIDDIVVEGKSLVTGEAPKEKEASTPTPPEERIETPPEPTELAAATGEVPETETDETSSRRRRRTSTEATESEE
jgi:large subunit ribosomal protein L21